MKNFTLLLLAFFSFCNNNVQQKQEPYTVVEQMPSFPGGETKLYQFINRNLKYPVIPEDQELATKTVVRFTITKTGEIKDVQPAMDKYKDLVLTDSLIAIIKRMPNWNPGKHNGKTVDVYYTIPLHISPARR
ncbi:energy transducer TonB [Dysgonomonas sp.]|jgi:protein TonB